MPGNLQPRTASGLHRWKSLRSEPLDPNPSGEVMTISTAKFTGLVVAVAMVFTLYIGHVYRTQDLLNELQQLQRENLRLHLHHNQLTGEHNAALGPAVIYERAPGLGLQDGFAYAPLVRIR